MISTQYAIDVTLKRDDVPNFEVYPFSLPAIHNLDTLAFHPAVTFLIGENGSDGIERVDYFETEHYRVMHDFVANPQRMLGERCTGAPVTLLVRRQRTAVENAIGSWHPTDLVVCG